MPHFVDGLFVQPEACLGLLMPGLMLGQPALHLHNVLADLGPGLLGLGLIGLHSPRNVGLHRVYPLDQGLVGGLDEPLHDDEAAVGLELVLLLAHVDCLDVGRLVVEENVVLLLDPLEGLLELQKPGQGKL